MEINAARLDDERRDEVRSTVMCVYSAFFHASTPVHVTSTDAARDEYDPSRFLLAVCHHHHLMNRKERAGRETMRKLSIKTQIRRRHSTISE